MNILILGATGFIGHAIFHALTGRHNITTAGRSPIDGYEQWRYMDFNRENNWDEILEGMEMVINAIGIIEGDFNRVQAEAPMELYSVCMRKNIRIIHISAIGAEKENPITPFLQTKKVTDDFLLKYDGARVVYPGVVIGKDGKSSQFLAELAQLPVIPLFSKKPVPFVHISQLAGLIRDIAANFDGFPGQVFAVSKPEPIQRVLAKLKGKKARVVHIPGTIFKIFFGIFPRASIGILNKATFRMFMNTSTEDYEPLFPEASQKTDPGNVVRGDSLPRFFALLAIAFIWFASGVFSFISWDESYRLMQEIGAGHQASVFFIWSGGIMDIFLGTAVLFKKHRKKVIMLQICIMITYMLILTVGAPVYWIHPFGVLTKNIPLLALSYYLLQKQ